MEEILKEIRKDIQHEIALAEGEITASEVLDKCFERLGELFKDKKYE